MLGKTGHINAVYDDISRINGIMVGMTYLAYLAAKSCMHFTNTSTLSFGSAL